MKAHNKNFTTIQTVAEYTELFGLPSSGHPLFTIVDLAAAQSKYRDRDLEIIHTPFIQQLYSVFLKRNLKGLLRYGHKTYDFSSGVLGFIAPGQVFAADSSLDTAGITGWMVIFHPDLLSKYPLVKKIENYGFFSYDLHEALHLSAKEESIVNDLINIMKDESHRPIDAFSQDVLVGQLDLLFSYANRFYHRQFITRRTPEHDLLSSFESLLKEYLKAETNPLPTVQFFADALSVSASYLSDMLRSITGQNAQQHIHQAIIIKAKAILLSTNQSISETAYQLGFEYPQYFSRLFRSKTGLSPAAFRASAN